MREHPLAFAEDLDQRRCSCRGCGRTTRESEIYMHSRCHPSAPTWSSYRAGVLSLWCAACDRLVCAIAVARRGDA